MYTHIHTHTHTHTHTHIYTGGQKFGILTFFCVFFKKKIKD